MVRLLLAGLLLAASVVAIVAAVPSDMLALRLGVLSPDGSIDGPEAIVSRARWLAPILFVLAAGVWISRSAAVEWLDEAARELWELIRRAIRSSWMGLARREPTAWALLVIVLAGAGLRAAHLTEPVEYDEAWTVMEFVSQSALAGLTEQREANNHVFHTLVARPFFLAAGYSMWAIRLPAFLAGVLLIPMTFLLGRAMGGTAVGLWSAALTVPAGPLLLYSFRARGYAFVALAFVVLLVLGHRALRRPGPGPWLGFVLVASLGAMTIPVMVYPFLATVFWLSLASMARDRTDRRRLLRRLGGATVATGILTFLLYSPLLLVSGPRRLLRPPFAAPVTLDAFLAHYMSAEPWLALAGFLSDPLPAALAMGIAVGAVAGCFRWVHRQPEPAPLLGLLAIPPVVLVQLVLPPERVWVFLVPLFIATGCVGWAGALRALVSGRSAWGLVHAWGPVACALALAALVQWRSDFFPRVRYLAGFDDPDAFTGCLERLAPDDALLVKGIALWPTRFLLAKHDLPASWLSAHRREDFSGRLWAVSVQDPLEVSIREELADGRTRPELMAYSRPVATCGNATLHEMASTPADGEWASTPAAQPNRVAP